MFFRIVDEPYGVLFHKLDQQYKQPRAIIKIHVVVPAIRDSLENDVYLDILLDYLIQEMAEDTYSASLASLNYSVYAGERGFFISLSGYNEKLPLLLQTILQHFQNFEKNLNQVKFDAICEQAKKDYYKMLNDSSNLSSQVRHFLMRDVFR